MACVTQPPVKCTTWARSSKTARRPATRCSMRPPFARGPMPILRQRHRGDVPGIAHVDAPDGRRAVLAHAGIEVWEVIARWHEGLESWDALAAA